jgi:transposase
MRKFKFENRDQLLLLPPNLDDWLPEDHLARFVLDLVESMDRLEDFYKPYMNADGSGQPPYDPGQMVSLLVYCYCSGVLSSRQIEKATWDDVPCRYIMANAHPDHDTIATFRKKHEKELKSVFKMTVKVSMKAGMVRLGHVSLDGTKIRANAALGKRRSQQQLEQELADIEAKFGDLLEQAERADEEDDKTFGKGNGGGLPPNLAKQQTRKETIKKALAELEKQEKEQREKDPNDAQKRKREQQKGFKQVPRVNTTDSDSRVQKFPNGSLNEGYNAQIVVDDDHAIIVAAEVVQDGGDRNQLVPMVLKVEESTGWLPEHVTADTGYYSEKHLLDPRLKNVQLIVKPQRPRRKECKTPKNNPVTARMQELMDSELGRSLYSIRKTLVEPVFGAIKQARGIRQFLRRGLQGVRAEWDLICSAHNVLKMYAKSKRLAGLI